MKENESLEKWKDWIRSNYLINASVICIGSSFSCESKNIKGFPKQISEYFDNNYINLSDKFTSNEDIINTISNFIQTNLFHNKVILLELIDDKVNVHSTLNKVESFIEWNKKYDNIVVPFYSKCTKSKLNSFYQRAEYIRLLNIEGEYSISDKLSSSIDTQEGNDILSNCIVRYIINNKVDYVFSKRDDIRIEISELEEQLFKVWDTDRKKEFQDNLNSAKEESSQIIKELTKQIEFLESELEIKTEDIRKQSIVENKLQKQIKLKETVLKNVHSNNHSYITDLEKRANEFEKQKKLLKDRDDELNEYKEERENLISKIFELETKLENHRII
jgi:hypothetical protein